MTVRDAAATALLAAALLGCSTQVKVVKVPENETKENTVSGYRYSLPKSFLLMTPSAAQRGGYTIEPLLLPDLDKTYAIQPSAGLGTLTFEVETKDGLLTKIVLNSSTAAVSEEAARVAAELAKAELEARAERAEERAALDQENREQLAALQKAVADAEQELELATLALTETEALLAQNPSDALRIAVRDARLRKRTAELELARAQESLDAFAATLADSESASSLARQGGHSFAQVKGPVLYRIVDTCDPWKKIESRPSCKVSLQEVKWPGEHTQLDFPVSAPPRPSGPPIEPPELARQVPVPIKVVYAKGLFVYEAALTKAFKEYAKAELHRKEGENWIDEPLSSIGLAIGAARSSIAITLRQKDLSVGIYRVTVHFKWAKGKDLADGSVAIRFDVPAP